MNEELSTTTQEKPAYKWSWGAFSFNWLWGVGNDAYLTLFALIPVFNIIWIFVCGVKGKQWAWESGKFRSVEEFERVQKTWDRAGLVYFIVLLIGVLYIVLFMVYFVQILAALESGNYYYY